MATVDELVNIATNRADIFASSAAEAIAAIDARRGSVGYSTIGVDIAEFDAAYVPPAVDTTPFPHYTPPTNPVPTAPTLTALTSITAPTLPTAPVLNTTGLFAQVQPSSTMPDWDEAAPALHVDEIYNELAALAKPIINDISIPSISEITIGVAPTLQLPTYEAAPTPEAIPAPTDYAAYLQSKYDTALPEMKAFVDDMVDGWVQKFAPEFYAQRDTLHTKLMNALNGEVLDAQFENALFSRARARAMDEFTAAEDAIITASQKKGFITPPGAITAAINKARIAGAKSLSAQSTEVYLKRKELEVQHLQFVMNLTSTQVQSVRGLAVQFVQAGLGILGQADEHAKALTNAVSTMFEHEKSRHEFSLAIMRELNGQYEVKLKAALSGLEGYKLELEAQKLRTDVDVERVKAATAQVEMQQLQVQRYSAIVDAIAKRAVVDELKIKEYSVRADVFQTNVKARLAAFDAYRAAIDGDKAKLEGELAKLQIFDGQIKTAALQVDIQKSILDGDAKNNAAKIAQYGAETDVYKTTAQIALQKFTAEAELKRLGLDVYKSNVEAQLEVYKGQLQKDIAFVSARIEAFKGSVDSLSNFYRLQQGYTELDLKKTDAIASGYSNMAAAALQSLNSMVSLATTA